jgi:hypothetical protein
MLNPQASRALAAEKWPGVPISAYGDWALCSLTAGIVRSVYLFTSEGAAYRASETVVGPWKIEQLRLPTPVPKRCAEIGYE